jgi:hypothetical protein
MNQRLIAFSWIWRWTDTREDYAAGGAVSRFCIRFVPYRARMCQEFASLLRERLEQID